MTNKQPDALRLAAALDLGHPLAEEAQQAAALLRTQRAALERKNALLGQVREVLRELRVNPEGYDFGPAYEGAIRRRHEVLIAIKQELAK